tara:strand:- start:424 stop:600 length:177 start_codon:yes stop_codon:yes gene_type:complete
MKNKMVFCFGIFFLFACLPIGVALMLYWYWKDIKRIYNKDEIEGKINDIKTSVLEAHK